MPKQARDYTYHNNYTFKQPYPQVISPAKPVSSPIRRLKPKKKKKTNFFASLTGLIFAITIGLFVLPYGFDRISLPLLTGSSYSEIKTDYNKLLSPLSNYLSNDYFIDQRLLSSYKGKPQMTPLYTTDEMRGLDSKLKALMAQYKTIDPSIFVWDYDTGKYVDIKASKQYSAASIIKIPVLIRLFKSIEANQLTIYDEMQLNQYFKAPGSGGLQYKQSGGKYTINELAREMIVHSDNSATNMIMAKIGGMPDVNAGVRNWGLKNTQINTWLPDMSGTNYTTAKDLAVMLYNLDNPGFLNINSREYIIDYMSHVENNRLIQAGLDPKALFIHKTGDIGKMLGDAGIVFTPSGKRYIIVILANRPYNSPLGKNFIQQASSVVYSSIMSGQF